MADQDFEDIEAKGQVQTDPLNKLPVPEQQESATEAVYGSRTDLAEQSLFNEEEHS